MDQGTYFTVPAYEDRKTSKELEIAKLTGNLLKQMRPIVGQNTILA